MVLIPSLSQNPGIRPQDNVASLPVLWNARATGEIQKQTLLPLARRNSVQVVYHISARSAFHDAPVGKQRSFLIPRYCCPRYARHVSLEGQYERLMLESEMLRADEYPTQRTCIHARRLTRTDAALHGDRKLNNGFKFQHTYFYVAFVHTIYMRSNRPHQAFFQDRSWLESETGHTDREAVDSSAAAAAHGLNGRNTK